MAAAVAVAKLGDPHPFFVFFIITFRSYIYMYSYIMTVCKLAISLCNLAHIIKVSKLNAENHSNKGSKLEILIVSYSQTKRPKGFHALFDCASSYRRIREGSQGAVRSPTMIGILYLFIFYQFFLSYRTSNSYENSLTI